MPFTFFGDLTRSWKIFHSPWPTVPPKALGCWSDMSNTTVLALEIGRAVARVIASGYELGLNLLLPDANPPSFAHASAACGVVRNVTNARMAGVSRNVTSVSPATSTPSEAVLIDGNVAALKSVAGFAFVDERITPATKSPSNTIAAFGGVA